MRQVRHHTFANCRVPGLKVQYESGRSGDPGIEGATAAELRRAMREAAEDLDFERAAALRDRLRQRKAESGFAHRDDIQTFVDYIDADEVVAGLQRKLDAARAKPSKPRK